MSNHPTPSSPLRRAFLKIEELEARLQASAAARSEPLALVGMGCRLPGDADSPAALWQLLAAGRDATGEIPTDRWNMAQYFDPEPGVPGKMYTTRGGFLRGVDGFDAAFFGISPREAAQLDPQQRLLLEVTWEALENASIAPHGLRGSRTGVYVGLATYDYAHLQIKSGDPSRCDAYFGTGTAASVASGRLAYTLGTHGPAISIDTACSSSLVALHLACRALRHGDCDLALVGGVNLILSPETVISMCQSRMMAADGRCKTFDAAADGFGQAEGCAVVVVKRLSDAERDGDRILALVRGTAVNQDGASSGLTAPNGPAQEAVIRAALADAGLQPQDVSYVEAHGTGTTLGDPIEVRALSAVYGAQRTKDRPLWIGSIKTNLGHLEAAAGLAGLLKVVLALEQQEIPAHLHFHNPNPLIPWQALPVRVADRHMAFEPLCGKRIAGLSSFGFSGTNAHILIEEAPPPAARSAPPVSDERPLQLFTLAARNQPALRVLAERYQAYFAKNPQQPLADVAYSANTGRSPAEHRIAVIARDTAEVGAALAALVAGEASAPLRTAVLDSPEAPRVAFLFTGQGSQYAGMGRELFESEPAFRAAFERCDTLFAQHLPGSLRELVYGHPGERGAAQHELDQTLWTQPALFAVEWALTSLWRCWGIEPALVLGHSIGEYVAACASGVCSLEDAVRLVATRAQLMSRLPAGGAMAAVLADERHVLELVGKLPGVSIAAVNGPRSTVISGPESGVAQAERQLKLAGIASLRLTVSHAFHSALLDPMLDEFQDLAESVVFRDPSITLISNLSGQAVRKGEVTSGDYWRRHARGTVRFADGLRSAYDLGYRTFVEIGPKPVLSGLAAQCLGDDCLCLPSLCQGQDAWPRMLETLRQLYLRGVRVDWFGFDAAYPRRKLELPTYPFQRERYWVDERQAGNGSANLDETARSATAHPHLERRIDSALGDVLFEARLDPSRHPYLADHVVHGELVLPMAFYLEVILAAVREFAAGGSIALENLIIHEPIRVPLDGKDIQLILSPGAAGVGQVRLFARDLDNDWKQAVSSQFSTHPAAAQNKGDCLAEVVSEPPLPDQQAVAIDEFYGWCSRIGLEFGPSFHGLRSIYRRDNEAVGLVELPASAGSSANFGLHPAALDACLQTLAAALPGFDPLRFETEVYMPIGIDRFELTGLGRGRLTSRVRLDPQSAANAETLTGHVVIEDASGVTIGRINALHMKRAPRASLVKPGATTLDECFYEVRWDDSPSMADSASELPEPANEFLLFADSQGIASQLQSRLCSRGARCVMVYPGDRFQELSADTFQVDSTRSEDFDRLLGQAYRDQGRRCDRIVFLWPVDCHLATTAPNAELSAMLERCCRSLLGLLHAVVQLAGKQPPRLWLVTAGAQAVGVNESMPGLAQTAVWGLGKVIALEHPELNCVRIDLEPGGDVELLLSDLATSDEEPLVAYRGGRRRVARLVRLDTTAKIPSEAAVESQPLQLEIVERGTSAGVALRPARRRPLAAGQVEIEVRAAGLNFRDVLNVLGVREDDAPLGSEVAGVVTATAEFLEGIRVGDEVVAIASGGFGSYANAPAELVLPKPENIDFAAAAASPLAFLTAQYALQVIGRMAAGERVLIHAAAGGVGLAAVQLAQRAGLDVLATAGSPAKRDYLRSIGVAQVFDSRSLDFAEEIRRATHGQGLDLVLNSLTGPAIAASLGLLRPKGRFLEIGKSEIWSAAQAAAVNPGAVYCVVDLAEQIAHQPNAVRPLFVELLEQLSTGQLRPLPVKTFPLAAAADAIEHMARARHIGKVVLLPSDAAGTRSGSGQNCGLQLAADGTYLISGGLTGLGLAAAAWLVEHGARNLLLFGRRAGSATAERALEAMRLRGVRVVVAQADVSREEDMRGLFEGPLRSLPPLRGVIHSAGRLEDGVLMRQDWARFVQVLAPKVQGAWLLHRMTADCPLDFFVLFSSASALLGAPGQANYAAANAFLDGLAHYRRARGLPGLSINWGAWAQIGVAAERNVGQRIGKLGIRDLTVEEGFRSLERLLLGEWPQVGVIRADWSRLHATLGNPAEKRFFAQLAALRTAAPMPGSRSAVPLAARALSEAPPEKRHRMLLAHVRDQVASVIGLAPGQSAPDKQPLRDMGLDSLMAVELRNRLRIGLGIERALPATLVFDHPSVAALTEYLATEVYGWVIAPVAARAPEHNPSPLELIEQLSDEDVEKLLSLRLG